ncbi:MAG: hypothetical protein WBV93_02905 [Anaerobacillus sp.]
MDNLIDLLLNNILFVIIAIGGIVSFFKRMGNEEDQTQKPRKSGQPSAQRNQHRSEPSMTTKQSEETQDSLKPVSAYQEALERISDRNDPQYELKVQRPLQKQTYKKHKRLSLSKREVRNGVLWSEILGPPRSKKPHSFNHFARYPRK